MRGVIHARDRQVAIRKRAALGGPVDTETRRIGHRSSRDHVPKRPENDGGIIGGNRARVVRELRTAYAYGPCHRLVSAKRALSAAIISSSSWKRPANCATTASSPVSSGFFAFTITS